MFTGYTYEPNFFFVKSVQFMYQIILNDTSSGSKQHWHARMKIFEGNLQNRNKHYFLNCTEELWPIQCLRRESSANGKHFTAIRMLMVSSVAI